MQDELKKEIKGKIKDAYKQSTQPSEFEPGIFFDASFEAIGDSIREAISKNAEDEVISYLTESLMNNALFRIFIREALKELDYEENSDATQFKIQDVMKESSKNENIE